MNERTRPRVSAAAALTAALAGIAWLAPAAAAQSNVRPVPRVALPAAYPAPAAACEAAPLEAGARAESALAAAVWERPAPLLREEQPALEHLDVLFRGRFFGRSDFEDGQGGVGIQRGNWSATLTRALDDRRVLALAFESEASFYDLAAGSTLLPDSARPFNDLYRTRLAATLYSHWSGRASLFSGFEVALGGEDRAALGASVTLGGSLGIAYQASPELRLAFGLAGSSRLEDDAWVIPFLGVDWQFARDWRLVVEGERVGLDWQPSERFAWRAYAAYEQRQFRLNDSGPLPGGVLRDEQIDLGATFAWRPRPGVELRLGGGWAVWREFNLFERHGGQVNELEIEPAPYLELGLSFSF